MSKSGNDNLVSGDIGTHVRRLAIPTSVGFFFMILYNIIDTLVAGYISTNAQAGLAFSFPLFFIVIAASVGVGQAVAGMVARARGARHFRKARYYVGQATVYCLGLGVCIALIGHLFSDDLLTFLVGETTNSSEQHGYALSYSLWIFSAAPLFHLASMLSGVLSANGNTTAFRNAIITTTLLNIVLDPVLAFGWLGLPALGMSGIALATVLTQVVQIMMLLPPLLRLPVMRNYRRIFFAPRRVALSYISAQALPPTLHMLAIGGGFMIITYYLARLDDFAVAAYGIAIRIEQLLLIHTIGLSQALLAIAGQNFGARELSRVTLAFRTVIKYGLVLSLGSIAILLLAGKSLLWLFNSDPHIIDLGFQYLVVAALLNTSYVVAHSCVAMMQALGRPALIGPYGALRLIVLPLVFCLVLVDSLQWGTVGVWTSLVLANILVTVLLIVTVGFMFRDALRISPPPPQPQLI